MLSLRSNRSSSLWVDGEFEEVSPIDHIFTLKWFDFNFKNPSHIIITQKSTVNPSIIAKHRVSWHVERGGVHRLPLVRCPLVK